MARSRTPRVASGDRVGIELDGTRATVVTVTGDVTTAVRTFTSDSGQQALREALASVSADAQVRIVLSSPALLARAMDVTSDMSSRVRLSREALRLLRAPDGFSVSAVISDQQALASGRLVSGLALALPAEQPASAYQALSSLARTGEVVAFPAVACALEGLSLAIRGRSVDLCLVRDSQPVAFAVLQALGVESLVSGLGGAAARSRVDAALAGSTADPLAAAEVARWVESLAAEVAGVCASWRASGIPVPPSVVVHGQGASASGLAAALRRHDMSLGQTDLVRQLGPVSANPSSRLEPVTALLAAQSVGTLTPASVFVSAEQVRAAHARAAARSARATARTALLATALVLLPATALLSVSAAQSALAHYQADSAAERLSASRSGLNLVDAAVASYADALLSQSLTFPSRVMDLAFDAQLEAQAGVRTQSVRVDQQAPTDPSFALVTLAVPGSDPQPAADWMRSAAGREPQMSFQLDSFSASDDGFTVTVRLAPKEASE